MAAARPAPARQPAIRPLTPSFKAHLQQFRVNQNGGGPGSGVDNLIDESGNNVIDELGGVILTPEV